MSSELDVLKDIRRILKKIFILLRMPYLTEETERELPKEEY